MRDTPTSNRDPRGRRGTFRPLVPIAVVAGILVAIFGGYEVAQRILAAPQVAFETPSLLHLIRGAASSLLLAGIVAWYLLRTGMPVFPPAPGSKPPTAYVEAEDQARHHGRWFVRARWFAMGVIFGLILIAGPFTGLLPREALARLIGWWAVLPAANLWFHRTIGRTRSPERHLVGQAILDLVVLTGLLNASGGLENPFYVAYIFHVILAAIVLPRRRSLAVTGVAAALFITLVVGEAAHVIPHYENNLYPHTRFSEPDHPPLAGPDGRGAISAAYDPVFVSGEAGTFLFVLMTAAWLTMLVTDRLRQSEEHLERTARAAVLERGRLESVVHAAGVGMILLDLDLSVRWFSPLASEWLGWDESVIGRRCPLYEPGDGREPGPAARVLETGRPAEMELTLYSDDGSPRRLRRIATPLRDAAGRVVQVVEVVEDVTVRRALEAEALHAGKMSILGRMAAGIAHEIGNPLSSMAARLRLMEQHPDAEFLQTSLGLLQGQVSRIGRIVHAVSQFARMPRQEWMIWDVNAAVEEAMGVAELDSRLHGISFQRAMATPSPRVRGVRDQVVQVVLNLLLNAAEAMSGHGSIVVETSQEQGEVAIAVKDTGVGMDEKARARLFEPFFTTKPRGTGLGLSISYTLVHAHGGRFQVDSEPGRGTRFVVLIPSAEGVTAAPSGT